MIAALVDAGERHRLPLHLLDRYMASMRVDCDARVRIASEAELDRYMDGSAGDRRADHGAAARRPARARTSDSRASASPSS